MKRLLLVLGLLICCAPSFAWAAKTYSFSGATQGSPGDTVTVVVDAVTDVEIKGYSICFVVDRDVFSWVSSTLEGTRGEGAIIPTFGSDSISVDTTSVKAGVVYSIFCPAIPAGTGALLKVNLEIKSDAPSGSTFLHFQDISPALNRLTDCLGGTHTPGFTDGTFQVLSATPVCDVDPTSLDFGSVELGDFAEDTFTITNNGGGTLAGTVTDTCATYSIESGASYSLTAGQTQVVTVRFTPSGEFTFDCTIDTGADCSDVTATGIGYLDPLCGVSPTSLDFGSVELGDFAEDTFTITNNGGGTLAGTVTDTCATYSIESGASYSLTAGQTQVVTVRFTPSGEFTFDCTIDTGADCSDVTCTGIGIPPTSDSRYFFSGVAGGSPGDEVDIVVEGETTEEIKGYSINFFFDPNIFDYIESTIDGTRGEGAAGFTPGHTTNSVSADVVFSPDCPPSIPPGTGPLLVVTLQVRNDAPFGGTDLNLEDLPPALNRLTPCDGPAVLPILEDGSFQVVEPPICEVEPTTLDFSNVAIGSHKDLDFTITNVGGGTLYGFVRTADGCEGFSIVAGGGLYELDSDESLEVTVRFAPPEMGDYLCTVETVSPYCEDVSCTGMSDESAGTGEQEESWITAIQAIVPNPLSKMTAIHFSLERTGPVSIDVFDPRGRLVRRLSRESLPAGLSIVEWDGRSDSGNRLPSGVYYMRLTACGKRLSRTMIMLD